MSRGPGRLQRLLFRTIRRHGKPMTFPEIHSKILQAWHAETGDWQDWQATPAAFEHSLRRTLRRMVDDQRVLAVCSGDRRDPHRYCIDPVIIAIGDKGEFDALCAALEVGHKGSGQN